MAKKLVYNYTFTPGASNVGTIEIEGNYPTKTWQLITDTGTGGTYKHTFIRDELFSSTGAIQIINNTGSGSGDLKVATVGTSLDEDTGIMTVTTSTAHGLNTGATIKFREESVTFTCAKDNYASEKKYPRTTDPVYDTAIAVTVVDSDTFTVDVGRPVGGNITSDNEIIYNFSDATKGGSAYYFSDIDKTILTLHHDTSHLDYRDDLQIFIDIQEDKVDFSETFVDPVSKLRVSNPQNLIDTDFEYGLQPTKWETVELVNNIPSFYSNSSDYSLRNIVRVSSVQGSQNITVQTAEINGLSVGSPIDVQGLASRTAEGKFLITRIIDAKTFVYKAKKAQESTVDLSGSYTVIIPGQFYQGSEVVHDEVSGIETDAATPSTLTISTKHTHGFESGSSLYLTNTVGRKRYTLTNTTTDTAPDGRPYVDHVETLSSTVTTNPALNETRQYTGTYAHKFTGSSVSTSNNTITWEGNQLRAGDVLLYVPPSGDTHIGGLERFQIYYVKTAETDTITLCETTGGNYSGNSTINLSSTGTSNNGRHQLIMGYEFGRVYKRYQYRYVYYRYNYYGQGSGWDTQNYSIGNNSYNGLGQTRPTRYMIVDKSGGGTEYTKGDANGSNSDFRSPVYRPSDNSNFTFNKSGTEPDGYDFIEDFQRWSYNNWQYWSVIGNGSGSYAYNSYGRYYGYSNGAYNFGNNTTYYYFNSATNRGKCFVFYLKQDPEGDSLYSQNHGLIPGSTVTITTASGNDIKVRTDTGTTINTVPTNTTVGSGTTHSVEVLGSDRFRLGGSSRIISANGTYTVSGTITNPTRNTLYLTNTDLTDNQTVDISPGTGGVIPTSTSGALTPSTDSISTVYEAVKTALDGVKTTMGSDSTSLLMNGGSDYIPFSSSNQTWDGARQSLYLYRQQYGGYFRTSNGNQYVNGSYVYNKYGWANGQPFDPMENTDLYNRGFEIITTPYSRNTSTPYWMDVYQTPDFVTNGLFVNGSPMTHANFRSTSSWGYNWGNHTTESDRRSWNNNITSLGGGWEYWYTVNYMKPDTQDHGYLNMSFYIWNTNWAGYKAKYSSTTSQTYNYYNSSYYYPYWNSNASLGQNYQAVMIIPIKSGSTASKYGISGSLKTNASIASDIATAIKNKLTFAALTSGTVNLNQVTSNRFSLKDPNNDQIFNLTNSGTAPIQIATEELTGGADGYYSVDVDSDNEIKSFSTAEIPKRELTFNQTGIVTTTDNSYLNITNNKLRTGQAIVYDAITGGLSGITSGTTYYAIATGPDHFELANSAINAEGGNAIGIGSTASGSFKISIPSVSGISQGIGTVGLSSSKAVVTGVETLFQRFFKSGDEFKVKDTSTTPPRYANYLIQSVISDTELSLTEPPNVQSDVNTQYYVESKIYTRPDGAFLHRPFDGGVEINAGTSPNSSIVRQTRKYFRYQSGKGIQCSLAINFNPSRLAKSIVSTASTTIPTEIYSINFNNSGSGTYNLSGNDRDGRLFGQNQSLAVMKGDNVSFVVNASGHPLWIKSTQSVGTANSITADITNNGTQSGTIVWDTSNVTPGTYYYNCENHASMSGSISVEAAGISTTIAKVSTEYPHGLTRKNDVTIRGATDSTYNGSFNVKASNDFDFSYYLPTLPSESVPNGVIEYNIDQWNNSNIRCGLYDYQNGMFFEFDGNELWCVRRSSVQQLPGKGSIEKGGNILTGTDTNFSGQLGNGDYIVIRGGSYRITKIVSKTELHVQPSYQGQSTTDAILTKTVDVRVRQADWNIDKADGKGPSGFKLDLTKIQMAYMDYSWYGAGKIRFGFKDTYGHVKYMHEFRHNNRLEEAYMRTGNIAGRYEIKNSGIPSYVPSLFHWGTSIIMDGKFDDDKAYLFTAPSNTLQFTNGDSNTANTAGASSLISRWAGNWNYDYYVKIPFSTSDANKFSSGAQLYTADEALYGDLVDFTDYSGGNFNVYVYIETRSYWQGNPAVYPSIGNNVTVSVGAPASGSSAIELTSNIPLISIRLAPSVDNNLTGPLGAREIINRMQLQLKSLGITLTHDCNIDLILNGNTNNKSFDNVTSPSLSELVKHKAGDKVTGGTTIFSLRASGGAENAAGRRLSATSDFDLSQITDLGNCILGGDGTYPNGPDLLTIALRPVDTAEINADTPLQISSRITWTESQA